MQKQNNYYKDLIKGKILKPLIITRVREVDSSIYEVEGKLGGQNKPLVCQIIVNLQIA